MSEWICLFANNRGCFLFGTFAAPVIFKFLLILLHVVYCIVIMFYGLFKNNTNINIPVICLSLLFWKLLEFFTFNQKYCLVSIFYQKQFSKFKIEDWIPKVNSKQFLLLIKVTSNIKIINILHSKRSLLRSESKIL